MVKKPAREIAFAEIERGFTLARGLGGSPAVGIESGGRGYYIRILAGETRSRDGSLTTKWDYFYLDADGTVAVAPRGYARDYKPGRVVGMAEAVAKYSGGGS
jgi:hypothetical protein